MRINKNIVFLIISFNTVTCMAGSTPPRPQCLTDLGNDSEFANVIGTELGANDVQQWVAYHKSDFYTIVGEGIKKHCLLNSSKLPEFHNFLDTNSELPVKIQINNKWYDFFVSKEEIFNYLSFPTLVIVSTDSQKYSIGTEKEAKNFTSEINNKKCAQYWAGVMGLEPSYDTVLSDAAKNTFISKYQNQYALRYSRPQGALYEKSGGFGVTAKFEYVEDNNYYRQRENVKKFSEQLKNTACTGENIGVYLMYKSNTKDNKYTIIDGPYIIP